MRATTLLTAAILCWATPAHAFDDFQTWSTATVKYLQREKLRLAVGLELRLNDDSTTLWFARVSQQTAYRLSDRWSFDANLSYILVRAQGALELDTLRLELAATPAWKIGARTNFDLRTRLDLWLREGDVDEDVVLRLRPRLGLRLGQVESRRKFFFGAEVFFSESLGQLFQHRLFPIGAGLPVGRRARVELYAMILSARVSGDWRHDFVLGQSWFF